MGGLGNQLFQIFTTIAYGIKEKVKFVFPYAETLTTGIERPTYWNSFLSRLIPFTACEKNKNPTNQEIYSWKVFREFGFSYNEIPKIPESMNLLLYGYWQSYKYFDSVKDTIFRWIKHDEIRETVYNDYSTYFNSEYSVISMHFRIGDYKLHPDCHPILPKEYYYKSLQYIKEKQNNINNNITTKVLYFCEAEDNETVLEIIGYLQMLFEDTIFIKVDDTIPDWKQMIIMSLCDYHIIANSSFSWWGAYLNPDTLKIVCYPDIWFGPKILNGITHNEFVKDMYPCDWIRISINQ
jgi:hypothetical protein